MSASIPKILRLGGVLDLHRVPGRHNNDAAYAVDSTGRRWVKKTAATMGHEALLAEAVSWLLARRLSVPIPDAGVTGQGADAAWFSSYVHNVKHWGDAGNCEVRNLAALGRVLMLDAVLMNGDRHAGNIMLEPSKKGVRMTAWAIDFESATVGYPQDFADLSVDALPSLANLARGLPVALMRRGARQAAREARLLDAKIVAGYVAEACEIAQEPMVDTLAGALQDRLSRAIELTDRYLAAIEARP